MVDVVYAPRRRARISPAGTPIGLRGLAAAAMLGSLGLGGCSLVLDFDKPVDAGPADSALTETACMAFEPNDSPATAISIAAGDLAGAICGGGETDYFKITVDGSQSIVARITFMNRNGAGDLDLRLLDITGATVIDESRTSADTEQVDCPGGVHCTGALPAGDYLLQVLGFSASVQSAYGLHLELTSATPIDAGV